MLCFEAEAAACFELGPKSGQSRPNTSSYHSHEQKRRRKMVKQVLSETNQFDQLKNIFLEVRLSFMISQELFNLFIHKT